MNFINRQPGVSVVIAFIAGLLIGWFLIGWGAWPIQYADGAPQDLLESDLDAILQTYANLYNSNPNSGPGIQSYLTGPSWTPNKAAFEVCDLRQRSINPAEQANLDNLRTLLSGQNCDQLLQAGDPALAAGGADLGPVLIFALMFLILVGAILFVLRRRNALMEEAEMMMAGQPVPEEPPTTMGDEAINTIPLARFQSTYTLGRDTYDDSFSIENTNGDFLGECGVGISESIGTDAPKNVTAFEVWLFDKNDIRTVTKVIMSDHAFFDDALKAKLAPKGEPVLAREGEVIVLETASLIVNAEIKSMNYGAGTLPPQSYFDNFSVELSAWAKEGDVPEGDIQGRVDELLDY